MHLAKVPSLRDENCWPLCAITLAPLFLGAVWHGYTQLPSFYYNEQKRIREINNNSSSEVMLIRIRKMEEHIGPSDIPPPSQSMLCSVRVTLQNKNNKKRGKHHLLSYFPLKHHKWLENSTFHCGPLGAT